MEIQRRKKSQFFSKNESDFTYLPYKRSHGKAFKSNLWRVASAIFIDPLAYDWSTEYLSVKSYAEKKMRCSMVDTTLNQIAEKLNGHDEVVSCPRIEDVKLQVITLEDVKIKPQWKKDIVELRNKYYGPYSLEKSKIQQAHRSIPTKVRTPELVKALKEFKARFVYDLPKPILFQYLVAYQNNDINKIKEIEEMGRQKVAKYSKKVEV